MTAPPPRLSLLTVQARLSSVAWQNMAYLAGFGLFVAVAVYMALLVLGSITRVVGQWRLRRNASSDLGTGGAFYAADATLDLGGAPGTDVPLGGLEDDVADMYDPGSPSAEDEGAAPARLPATEALRRHAQGVEAKYAGYNAALKTHLHQRGAQYDADGAMDRSVMARGNDDWDYAAGDAKAPSWTYA